MSESLSEQINLSEEEKIELRKDLAKTYFSSNFRFLGNHKGFRKGALHLFMAVSGGGKSTLRVSLINDFLERNPGKRILLYLSEETVRDFKTQVSMNYSLLDLSRVFCLSESKLKNYCETKRQMLDAITLEALRVQADIFIYDNLTTSSAYGQKYDDQELAIDYLKQEIQQLNIPGILFIHTDSKIKKGHDRIIDQSDVRGSRTIANVSEYIYIMQSFEEENEISTVIILDKSRTHTIKNKFYLLDYNRRERKYNYDSELTFGEFNELFANQNKLGRKSKSDKEPSGSKPYEDSYRAYKD